MPPFVPSSGQRTLALPTLPPSSLPPASCFSFSPHTPLQRSLALSAAYCFCTSCAHGFLFLMPPADDAPSLYYSLLSLCLSHGFLLLLGRRCAGGRARGCAGRLVRGWEDGGGVLRKGELLDSSLFCCYWWRQVRGDLSSAESSATPASCLGMFCALRTTPAAHLAGGNSARGTCLSLVERGISAISSAWRYQC